MTTKEEQCQYVLDGFQGALSSEHCPIHIHTSKEEEIRKKWKNWKEYPSEKAIADYWLNIRQQALTEQKEKFREMVERKKREVRLGLASDIYKKAKAYNAIYNEALQDTLSELTNL